MTRRGSNHLDKLLLHFPCSAIYDLETDDRLLLYYVKYSIRYKPRVITIVVTNWLLNKKIIFYALADIDKYRTNWLCQLAFNIKYVQQHQFHLCVPTRLSTLVTLSSYLFSFQHFITGFKLLYTRQQQKTPSAANSTDLNIGVNHLFISISNFHI